MKCFRIFLFFASMVSFAASALHAQPTRANTGAPADRSSSVAKSDAEKDPILAAMLTELDRSGQLQLKDFQKPFFIQYRIVDIDDFETRASYGAPEGSAHNHARIARVTVLIGDYKTDSSSPRGDGAVELTALDNDPIALRSSLWMATDQAYKAALAAFAQKQAALKQVQTPPQADDLSREKPVISLAEPLTLAVDAKAESEWTRRVAELSGLYRTTS
jgi:TldD protein